MVMAKKRGKAKFAIKSIGTKKRPAYQAKDGSRVWVLNTGAGRGGGYKVMHRRKSVFKKTYLSRHLAARAAKRHAKRISK